MREIVDGSIRECYSYRRSLSPESESLDCPPPARENTRAGASLVPDFTLPTKQWGAAHRDTLVALLRMPLTVRQMGAAAGLPDGDTRIKSYVAYYKLRAIADDPTASPPPRVPRHDSRRRYPAVTVEIAAERDPPLPHKRALGCGVPAGASERMDALRAAWKRNDRIAGREHRGCSPMGHGITSRIEQEG